MNDSVSTLIAKTVQGEESRIPAVSSIRGDNAHSVNSGKSLLTRIASHGGSLALADQAIVSGTNFLTSLAVARICGKAELGVYMLAWTVTATVNEILTAIIVTPYNVISPTLDFSQKARYRGSMLLHQFALSVVCAVCLIIAAFRLRLTSSTQPLGALLGLLSSLIIVLVAREFVRRMYFAHLQMMSAVITDASACALQLLLIGTMSLKRVLSAKNTYFAIASVSVIPICAWLYMNRRNVVISATKTVKDFKQNWTVGKWILGSGVLWAGAMYIYPWLLIWTHGASSTGAWAACYGLVALSNPVLLGFGNYLGPRIALLFGSHGVVRMRRYVWQSSIVFALLLTPLCAVAWLWGDGLVQHLYGPAFGGYTTAIRILAVNVLVAGAVFPLSRGLFSIRRADLDLAINVIAIGTLFFVGVGLVRSYAVTGAAIGLALTNGITAIVRAGVFARVAHDPFES